MLFGLQPLHVCLLIVSFSHGVILMYLFENFKSQDNRNSSFQDYESYGKQLVIMQEKEREMVRDHESYGRQLSIMQEKARQKIQDHETYGRQLAIMQEKARQIVQDHESYGRQLAMQEKERQIVQDYESYGRQLAIMQQKERQMVQDHESYGRRLAIMQEKESQIVQDHESYGRQLDIMREKESQIIQDHESYGKQLAIMQEKAKQIVQDHESYGRQLAIMQEKERQIIQDHESYGRQLAIMQEEERQIVTSKQIKLIDKFRLAKHETQRSTVQYIADIREYCNLKQIDNSWFHWLSQQQRAHMYQLEDTLGLGEIPNVNVAVNIVKQVSEQTIKILSTQLEILQDALDERDIDKMKQLQKELSKVHLSTFIATQTDSMKEKIISTSRDLQVRSGGALWWIASFFYYALKAVYSML